MLQRPLPPNVDEVGRTLLGTKFKKRIVLFRCNSALQGLNNKVEAVRLEFGHTLERKNGVDRHPTLRVASRQREEELVNGQVGVGEVEVDYTESAHSDRGYSRNYHVNSLCLAALSKSSTTSASVLPSTVGTSTVLDSAAAGAASTSMGAAGAVEDSVDMFG
jgi:hypothetical protein